MKTYNMKGEIPKANEGYFDKDGKKNGVFEKYDEKNRLIGRYTYKKDVLHGPFEEYYPNTNGVLAKEGCNENGLLEGLCIEYSPSGVVIRESEYTKGMLNGRQCEYSEITGLPIRVLYFKMDVLHGPYEKYCANGQVSWAGVYREGNLVVVVRDKVYLSACRLQMQQRVHVRA